MYIEDVSDAFRMLHLTYLIYDLRFKMQIRLDISFHNCLYYNNVNSSSNICFSKYAIDCIIVYFRCKFTKDIPGFFLSLPIPAQVLSSHFGSTLF